MNKKSRFGTRIANVSSSNDNVRDWHEDRTFHDIKEPRR